MLTSDEIDEVVFQVLLGRMSGKRRYRSPILKDTVIKLCRMVRPVFAQESTLLTIPADIAIVGDIHGNIDDLLRIFERLHYPPATRYLFLGDYVDRGVFGTEVLLLLFSLKVKYPDHVFMLRGNHECESLSRFYGFHKELTSKYTESVYIEIVDIFSELPLCAVVGDRVFCVHGGISPDLKQVADLQSLEKPGDFAAPGVFADMVWSDPCAEIEGFEPNLRGCGFCFGGSALSAFLDGNNLDLLVRSHEICDDGIAWPFAGDDKNVERCLTVFSTSDYCERGNSAAILYIAADLLVNVEEFAPTGDGELAGKRVLPYWLCDAIARKEQMRRNPRRPDGARKARRADENESADNALQRM